MNLIVEKLSPVEVGRELVLCEEIRGADFGCVWHCHPEVEITWVRRGGSLRWVGDDISPIQRGEIVMLGSDLPHDYRNDTLSGRRQSNVHAVVVQFSPALFAESWLEKGCMTKVKKLLQRARFGLRVSGSTRDRAARLLGLIAQTRGLERFVCLIQLLSLLAASGDLRQLAAADFKLGGRGATLDRLGPVCTYIEDHFCEPLYLADLAKRGGMSESTFRRLLKQGTGRTLPEYINELRIAHACRLLAETERTASEIAHQCGFVTDTHFQCAFRKLHSQTPLAYRQTVRQRT